jgi:hypothetical protein
VIALDHLGLVPNLSFLFSIVLVPKAVRGELFKRRAAKDRLQSLFDTYAFFQRCDGYDKGATGIMDDPWGRELAVRDDLEFHGTLWVLERLRSLGANRTAALISAYSWRSWVSQDRPGGLSYVNLTRRPCDMGMMQMVPLTFFRLM